MNIEKLYAIASKPVRTIVGLMSGTSFDGLDIAVCEFRGSDLHTEVRLLHFKTVDYDSRFKEELKAVFSKTTADLQKITLLNAYIGRFFGQLVMEALNKWHLDASSIDLVASHGQTIFHAPRWLHGQEGYGNATLQIGDGDHLAVETGIITVSDFRQKQIAAGGEGAPLALYGDLLMFRSDTETRIMLNIGGIANFTFLPAGGHLDNVFSTDTGPGNTLIDQYVQANVPGAYYDKNAQLAATGTVNEELLHALLDHPFFDTAFPKTTGPELFNLSYLHLALKRSGEQDTGLADVLATLTAFSAETIGRAIDAALRKDASPFKIYLSGGGMHNPLLHGLLVRRFGAQTIASTAALGVDPDAKEAVLFALLANQAVAGRDNLGAGGRAPFVSMGKLSFPD